MYYHIEGVVAEMEPYLAVVDCGGVGYAVNTSLNTLSQLRVGKRVKLYTHLNVREDALELYGFASPAEKRCFVMLISVSGVGPKAALSILSSSTPEGLTMAIISGDEKALTVAPGIGKKIAQRVILELKDKMQKQAQALSSSDMVPAAAGGGTTGKMSDAAAALAVLGYSSSEIAVSLKGIAVESMPLEDIIRAALKNMMK